MKKLSYLVPHLLAVLIAWHSSLPAQIPEDKAYSDIDVLFLNKKLRETADKGLVKKWALSKGADVLTIEMTDRWTLMTRQTKLELTRRLLSLFAYYIANRDARNWSFSIVLEMEGTRLAEDRGTWWQKNKNPEVYQ